MPLLLGVRVPGTIEECHLAGCEVEAWACAGLLDYLIVADYNYTEPSLAVESFAAFCRGRCALYAQMGDMMGGTWRRPVPRITGRGAAQAPGLDDSYGGMLLTGAEALAAAANHYAWGADGIAFWNISCQLHRSYAAVDGPQRRDRILDWMNGVTDLRRIAQEHRTSRFLPLYKGFGSGTAKNYPHQCRRRPQPAWRPQAQEHYLQRRTTRTPAGLCLPRGRRTQR